MTILFDTNIIIDILQKREPFFNDSYQALRHALKENYDCLVSAGAVTDVFYILRKALQSTDLAKQQVEKISHLFTFADVTGSDINTALSKEMNDFEDAVVDAVAEKYKSSYIVTRNVKDFENSTVPAISPSEFLKS